MTDFELLVVGDGCTDNSAQVVVEFNDPRLRWHNLDQNYGSQWVANNYANETATADWIAYLGHDDIWYPTHLEAILRTARECEADVVTSVMALYGPPESGVRGIAGVFPTGSYGPHDFVPPSAFAHRRSLYENGIKWQDPALIAVPMDALFMSQAVTGGRRCASTGELTCFKFNAAWRRDSYKIKPVFEQQRLLERIESGVDFRQAELVDVVGAMVAGKFVAIQSPATKGIAPGFFVRQSRKNKGSDSRFDPGSLHLVDRKLRFTLDDQSMPFEWHGLEQHPTGGSFRWSGPSPSSTIDLPVIFDSDLRIRIDVARSLAPSETIKVLIRDRPLDCRITPTEGDGFLIEADVRSADFAASTRDFGVTIMIDKTRRPIDLDINEDRRWLGVAVSSVEIEPLT